MDHPHIPAQIRALTVSELNHQVRHLLETSFMQVWVEGELSSFSRPSSGHWYFTLKDRKCQVRCAMFRGFNQRVRSIPREGDLVRIRGKVSLYENRGDFQMIAEQIEPAGLGALQQAFEALKRKLHGEGLFAVERKRALPYPPRHIGIVTSPTGAAIHDILTVLARRCPSIPVTLYPTAVQGKAATADIIAAIERAQQHGKADVLIVGRGGGSVEDLWCFNEESLARALAACTIPTVSAVGHEVDVSIADFVADLRAPTPSAAAESISPDQQDWLRALRDYEQRLVHATGRALRLFETRLNHLSTRLRDPRRELQIKAQRLDELELRLDNSMTQAVRQLRNRVEQLQDRLRGQSPRRQLGQHQQELARLQQRLDHTIHTLMAQRRRQLEHLVQTLHVVSPLATLGRGYAIVQDEHQRIIRHASDVQPGDPIRARVAEGVIEATVTSNALL
ncbi:exodeoxyribonuclease VII large subunit [Marinobacter sp. X15-166B]|uniref:exodeoxyribonuclease VII large subunit n=1 Tax=Marinobacter sp. X15-166B TaxID=1897620 RepID=UPI00085BBFDC|nr:exodeoxyribonuclease VII large subunit [Marinobacter sp. X15-166B]OEY67233.1 exodeoxyribonuclease VII large subunit [Marinobacter sp. X15-166B]